MLDIHDDLTQYKVTSVVCSTLAISTTVYRLYVRWGRMWIDDAWAALALIFLFIQIASVFMHVDNPDDLSKLSRIAAYYMLAITFYTVTWTARISILYSIIRIDPSVERKRIYTWISGLYIFVTLFLVTQLFWVCQPESGWMDAPSPQCHLTRLVAICQLVLDIFADGFLLIAPLRLVVHIQERQMRIKLMIIFSTCLATTVVSMVHAAFIIATGGRREVISAIVEDCISLVVANVPVVATALSRFFERHVLISARGSKSVISTIAFFTSRNFGPAKPTTTTMATSTAVGDISTAHYLDTTGTQATDMTADPSILMDDLESGGKRSGKADEKRGSLNVGSVIFIEDMPILSHNS